jgi:hypothetical protein
MADSSIELARKQIEFARGYTLTLLNDVEPGDWFQQPSGLVTHLAWQVGHLAMAQYMLTLFRLRGKLPDDEQIAPKAVLRRFMKGTTPEPDPAQYPPVEEILRVFHGIHARVLEELPGYRDEDLTGTVSEPYAVSNTKLGSLLLSSHHEMVHAGQIGLLRRLLGKSPVR